MLRKLIAGSTAMATMAVLAVGFVAMPAAATPVDQDQCLVTPEVLEEGHNVHTDAVYKHHDAVTHQETVVDTPAQWQNFSPNKDQGPLEGQPGWPDDERGTWQHQDKAIPPGQDGPDGVYQNGEGNGSWFYRHHAVTHEVTVVDEEEFDELISEATDVWVVDVEHQDAVYGPCEDDQDYVTVAWRMPSWSGNGATWPQTYQDSQGTDEAELNVLDGDLPDGCYQIDVYYDSQTTTDLIAGKHLYSPGVPEEDLAWGAFEGNPWKFLKVGVGECNPVVEPGVATASWDGTPPSCLDLDGSGEFTFENATVTSAFRAGDDVDYASGFHTGTHENPFDGAWTVTLTADEGFVFAGGDTTKVLEFTIEHLTAEECVVEPPPVCSATEDTSHWQRYSWVGGPIPEGVTPEFLGADDENWQANTASDPHKIGVAGAYDRGKPGHADWFYLEWVEQPPCPTATGIPFSVTPEPASCTAPGSFDAASLDGVYNEETGRWEFPNVNVEVIVDGDEVTVNVFAHEGYVIDESLLDPEAGWFVEEGGARASLIITLDPQSTDPEACPQTVPQDPPVELSGTLDAPPAEAVEAEAQYAG